MIRQLKRTDIHTGTILQAIPNTNELLFAGPSDSANFYAIVTNFYSNAIWGTAPRDIARRNILAAFEEATRQRSINGIGVVLRQGEQYRSINSRYYWQLVDETTGLPIGSVVGYPYYVGPTQGIAVSLPNRIKIVIQADSDTFAEVTEYMFSGVTLGLPAMDEAATIPDAQIVAWGDGINDYEDMKSLICELNKRFTGNSKILDRHSNPHLMVPQSGVTTDDEGQQSFDYNSDGMSLPIEKDEPEYKYLTWDANASLSQYQLSTTIDLLHMTTGVPATAFGLSAGSGNSGVSRERQMFAAISKIQRIRRAIDDAFIRFGIDTVAWASDPFMSFNEAIDSEGKLVTMGIISRDEARARLGIEGKAPDLSM